MAGRFNLVSTPPFEQDARKRTRRNRILYEDLLEALQILRTDPYNTAGKHNIRKLKGITAGEGLWRLRVGDYRLRYDIIGNDVVLHSFRPRPKAY
jgi:mRNA-degrading endonuclease RelE of RelBE toxin-antitoxin system